MPVKPRIKVSVTRPNGHISNAEVKGEHCTESMITVAEFLLKKMSGFVFEGREEQLRAQLRKTRSYLDTITESKAQELVEQIDQLLDI